MMQINKIYPNIIFLFVFLLSACTPAVVVAPIPANTATANIFIKPTNTPIPSVIPNHINSLDFTATIRTTFTPTFSETRKIQATEFATFVQGKETQASFRATIFPVTLQAMGAKCKEGFVLVYPLDILYSSNDTWTAFTCSPINSSSENPWTPGVVDFGTRYTQITKKDLSKTWIIQHNTFDYAIINRPDALLYPYLWSDDGQYLYLYPLYYPGGDGFSNSDYLSTNVNDLYRMNLETGSFELVLRRDQYKALAFSPDGHLLVYSEEHKPDVIHVKDMQSGSDSKIILHKDIVATGAFVWNTDGSQIVFTIGYGKQGDNWQDDLAATSIFILTPTTMQVQEILIKDTRIFIPDECENHSYWLDKNTICLYARELNLSNHIFTFNVKTGNLK